MSSQETERDSRDATGAVGSYHFGLKKKFSSTRSQTFYERPGGMVFNSNSRQDEGVQSSTFHTSDASVLRGAMMHGSTRSPRNLHQDRHRNLDKEPAQSGPLPGFMHNHTSNNSRSADDLLSVGVAKMRCCTDEGNEVIGECFICYNAFDEESEEMTPRNLQCGHAYCTGNYAYNYTEAACLLLHSLLIACTIYR